MPKAAPKGKRDPFLTAPLNVQCEGLGIPLAILPMPRAAACWHCSGMAFPKPEPAAFAHFESLGFKGNFCEGSAPLMLMKCAALDYLAEANLFHDRSDACLRYFEAQCTILVGSSNRIVEAVRNATTDSMHRHFAEIRGHAMYPTLYPEMSIEGLLAAWNALGGSGWARIAEAFITDPYTFRAGWPDLSLANEADLRFVEVKTSDRLHTNQQVTISKLLVPLGLKVSVLKLIPVDAEA